MGARRHFSSGFVLIRWLTASLCLFACAAAPEPDAASSEAVLAVIDRCFEGMASHDSALLAESVLPEAIITRLRTRTDGSVDVYTTTGADFIREISRPGPPYRERIWSPEIMAGQQLATVRAPYDFHVDTTFSHCGVDHFTLIRGTTGWKIQSIAYTHDLTDAAGCRARYATPDP